MRIVLEKAPPGGSVRVPVPLSPRAWRLNASVVCVTGGQRDDFSHRVRTTLGPRLRGDDDSPPASLPRRREPSAVPATMPDQRAGVAAIAGTIARTLPIHSCARPTIMPMSEDIATQVKPYST